MILDSDSARARLDSPSNLINRLSVPSKVTVIPIKHTGRTAGKSPLPTFIRTQLAISAHLGANQTELGKLAGVTQEEVSQIKTSKIKGVDEEAVERALGTVRDKALDRLAASMGLMTDEKLDKCKAGELSTIAANMSKVVEKTLPRQESGPGTGAQVIIYAPQIKTENSYKTVEVG